MTRKGEKMTDSWFGPNVKALYIEFLAREAIPSGGGLKSAIEFLKNTELRKQVEENARKNLHIAIKAIKEAPDNPYGDDDEVIAGILLEKIKERKRNQQMKARRAQP